MQIDESALKDSAWEFFEQWNKYSDQEMSGKSYNNLKAMLRETIKVYLKQEEQNENI